MFNIFLFNLLLSIGLGIIHELTWNDFLTAITLLVVASWMLFLNELVEKMCDAPRY